MYGYNPTPSDIRQAMQALKDLGVTKVSIPFSGGNDEGGADDIDYFDADGNTVEGIPTNQAHLSQKWDADHQTFVDEGWMVTNWNVRPSVSRPATDEEVTVAKLTQVLEYPIYDRWGSFAGEFYVQGTLTWDVSTGKHTLEGQESHEVWESFSE
jgi:hypothetical protein